MKGTGRIPTLLWVAAGSALGAMARFAIAAPTIDRLAGFPWGMLLVNLLGCAAIGLLAGLVSNGQARYFLLAGVCGGFTSFSAFSLETLLLFEQAPLLAAGYVAATIGGAVSMTALGAVLATAIKKTGSLPRGIA